MRSRFDQPLPISRSLNAGLGSVRSRPSLAPMHPADHTAWRWLPPFVRLGGIYIGPTGERLRVCGCGRVEVIGTNPRPWSVAFYPTAPEVKR